MTFAAIQQGLELARSALSDVLQVDRSVSSAAKRVVGWHNRVPGINRDVYYPLEYQYLLDRAQYSFLLRDSSFLQFFYRFDDKGLAAARLAYYPPPLRVLHRAEDFLDAADDVDPDDQTLFDHLLNWYEAVEEARDLPLNTSHVRFDYDRSVTAHSKSHLQFGAVQELRLGSDHVPLPLAFIELLGDCVGVLEIDAADLQHARNHAFPLTCELPLVSIRAGR